VRGYVSCVLGKSYEMWYPTVFVSNIVFVSYLPIS
jgi:hypothetical protein